jgi:hypothetical protein
MRDVALVIQTGLYCYLLTDVIATHTFLQSWSITAAMPDIHTMCGRPTPESRTPGVCLYPRLVGYFVWIVEMCIYRFRIYVAIDVPLTTHCYTFFHCLVVAHIFNGYFFNVQIAAQRCLYILLFNINLLQINVGSILKLSTPAVLKLLHVQFLPPLDPYPSIFQWFPLIDFAPLNELVNPT